MKRTIILILLAIIISAGIASGDKLILITDPPQDTIFGFKSSGTTVFFAYQSETLINSAYNCFSITVAGPAVAGWVADSDEGADWSWWGWEFGYTGEQYIWITEPPWKIYFYEKMGGGDPGWPWPYATGLPGDNLPHPAYSVDIFWDYTGDPPADTAQICVEALYNESLPCWFWINWEETYEEYSPSFSYGTAEDPNPWCIKVGPVYMCGDADASGSVNVSDAVWIINYIFVEGESPMPYENGDVNCDSQVNVSGAVWIINYIFVSGPAPCEC